MNPYYTHVSKATTTPGHALIFRKDLVHEGALLEKGEKIIVSANIWVPREPVTAVVEVSFEETEKTCAIALQQVAAFPESALAAFVSFTDKQLGKPSTIYKYKCSICTYEEFEVVFKTLCQMYVQPEQVSEGLAVLDYFGLSPKNTMINFVPIPETVPEGHCALCTRKTKLFPCEKCKKVSYCGKKCQEMHWHKIHKLECNKKPEEKDFILFGSEEETLVASQTATELEQGYIRFTAVFGEGTLHYDDDEPYMLELSPLYVSFGDYNNIYYKRVLCNSRLDEEAEHIENLVHLPTENNKRIRLGDLEDESEADDSNSEADDLNSKFTVIPFDVSCPSIYVDLLVAKDGMDTKTIVKEIVKCDNGSESVFGYRTDATVLPCVGEPTQVFKHFQVDSEGKTCFTYEQAVAMRKYIEDTCLIERIAGQLNNVPFRLTQHVNVIDGAFCNESLYGACNLVEISGILRPLK